MSYLQDVANMAFFQALADELKAQRRAILNDQNELCAPDTKECNPRIRDIDRRLRELDIAINEIKKLIVQ